MTKTNSLTKALTEPVEWYDSPRQIVLRALGIAVGTVLVIFIGALLVVPKLYGGTALTVMSGSMQPSLKPGDVIVVRGIEPKDVCQNVGIGQIVTYFPESGSSDLITHRVESKTAGMYPDGSRCRLLTKGDNNNAADERLVSPDQVRGTFMYGVPAVGWARDWVMHNRVAAIIALGVIVAAYYLWPGSRDPITKVLQLGDIGGGAPLVLGDTGSAGGFSGAMPLLAGGPALPAGPSFPGFGGGGGSPGWGPEAARTDFDLRRRELELREREMRLREAEARREFGYVPPPPEPYMTI